MRKRKPLALAGIGLTAITMFLLTPVFLLALAGCGSASKTSTPAHAIAATGTTCSKMSSDNIIDFFDGEVQEMKAAKE